MRYVAVFLVTVFLVGLFFVPVPAAPQAEIIFPVSVTRGPYLQQLTPTSVIVRWRTDLVSTSRVLYGSAPGELSASVEDGAFTTDHEILLTGLAPEHQVFYAIGTMTEVLDGDDAETYFRTPPLHGEARRLRVWVIGDSGTANIDARDVRDAYTDATGEIYTDLWLMLGDNAYNDGTDAEYQAAVFDTYADLLRQTAVWPTLGNHDAHSADSAALSGPYYDIFSLPRQAEAGGVASGTEAYYSFDHANVHIVVLDSQDSDTSLGSAMLGWLEADLMATTADWVLAFWHHPPYSKGSHDSDSEAKLVAMRENVLPILESYGVDLVLAGHSHSYERSFLLDGHYGTSDALVPAMVLDAGDGQPGGDGAYVKPTAGPAANEGAVYVVAGSSGRLTLASLDHPAMYSGIARLGSLILEIDGRRLDATFLTCLGKVLDVFTLIKGDGAAAPIFADGFEAGDASPWSSSLGFP